MQTKRTCCNLFRQHTHRSTHTSADKAHLMKHLKAKPPTLNEACTTTHTNTFPFTHSDTQLHTDTKKRQHRWAPLFLCRHLFCVYKRVAIYRNTLWKNLRATGILVELKKNSFWLHIVCNVCIKLCVKICTLLNSLAGCMCFIFFIVPQSTKSENTHVRVLCCAFATSSK